jgi:NADH-quinone oxidoreductase subunit N
MAIIQMIGGLTDSLLPLLQGIAVLTMIVGSLIAIKQSSLKRMLAYSSIGHAGFIMLAILSSAYNTGARAPIFYLAAYTITNLAAFGVIMALEDNKDRDLTVADLAGLWQRNPWLTAVMTLALLSLAGAPPTAGFLAKFMVLASVWQAGWMWMAIAVAVASAISAYFYLRCVVQLFSNPNDTQAVTTSGLTRVGLLVVSAAIIVVGIMPWTLNSLAMAGN